MDPRSRGNLSTDVCVNHAGTHAVDDDEGTRWEQKKRRQSAQSRRVSAVHILNDTYSPSGPRAILVISSIVYMSRILLLA